MQTKTFQINSIPAVLWGNHSDTGIIAVHGNQSSKTDIPMQLLAETVQSKGYQVLSFDLPEHGDRKQEGTPCKFQNCVNDLLTILQYAKAHWNHISVFANSMGAYFSLLAYQSILLEKAWFLSPVVDMQCMIENMMTWFQITKEQLKKEQIIHAPTGQKLYWDDYCYMKDHPIHAWNIPTYLLYGAHDEVCEKETILHFAEKYACNLQIEPEAEHYFHTPKQLEALKEWMEKNITA